MKNCGKCCGNDKVAAQRQEEELKFITANAVPLLSTDFVKTVADAIGVPTVIQVWGKRSLLHDEASMETNAPRPLRSQSVSTNQQSDGTAVGGLIPHTHSEEPAESDVAHRATPLIFTSLGAVCILQAAVGENHALFLSNLGQVHILGVGEKGQLGLGKERLFVTNPEVVRGLLDGKTVKSIAAGLQHSVALTADGMVFAWGQATCVGDASGVNRDSPVQVNSGVLQGAKVQLIAAAYNQTMATTSENHLVVWGEAFFSHSYFRPHLHFEFNQRVMQISIGRQFAVAVLQKGQLVGWGDSTYCELGRGGSSSSTANAGGCLLPTEIPLVDAQGNLLPSKVVAAAAGARHCLLLTEDGLLYSFGDNLAGQGGQPTHIVRSPAPQLVRLSVGDVKLRAKAIFAGQRHSAALTTENKLLTWGHASFHKLIHTAPTSSLLESRYGVDECHIGVAIRSGLKDCVSKPKLVYSLLASNVTAVALGEDFTVVVTGDANRTSAVTAATAALTATVRPECPVLPANVKY